jgi:hypothetical protein
MAYSIADDLMLGDIPKPVDAVKYVEDASDEIDSKLALRYQTPVVVADIPENRMTTLLLKRINNWLASGRLICAKAASAELPSVHAYGMNLIKDATAALDAIASGQMPLPGATLLDSTDIGRSGPIVSNLDPESNVEAFYAMTQNPPVIPGFPGDVIFPAGTPRRLPYTW